MFQMVFSIWTAGIMKLPIFRGSNKRMYGKFEGFLLNVASFGLLFFSSRFVRTLSGLGIQSNPAKRESFTPLFGRSQPMLRLKGPKGYYFSTDLYGQKCQWSLTSRTTPMTKFGHRQSGQLSPAQYLLYEGQWFWWWDGELWVWEEVRVFVSFVLPLLFSFCFGVGLGGIVVRWWARPRASGSSS